jgi:multiple sugar transport system permease protein
MPCLQTPDWRACQGIEPGLMLGDASMALWLLVLVTAWWSFSYATVMMAAAVQSVPRELHEAVSMASPS